MPELAIKVLDFEGPLDLLIHLIEKDKIDIYDIPIVSITDQYISYLNSLREFDIEAASSFVVMAATLLQIKSRMLLPKLPSPNGEEEEADPRQMLVEMLVEYRKVKACAAELARMLTEAQRYHTRPPSFGGQVQHYLHQYQVETLLEALTSILSARGSEVAYVERQEFDVGHKMEEMVAFLRHHPEGVELLKAFAATGTNSEKIASFLALLELLKLRVVKVSQSSAFAAIYLFLRQGGGEHVPGL